MGIKSLKHVYDRCVPGDGQCQIWQQSTGSTGYPQASIEGRPQLVARWVLEQRLGRPLLPKHCATPACGDKRCVSADCLREVSKSDVLRNTYRSGKRRADLEVDGRRSAMLARGVAKLDMSKARQIRLLRGTDSAAAIGRAFGVSAKTVTSIWSGVRWAEAANGSSVFLWRPAA